MILCCGEALIDMIPTRAADARAAFVPHSGGSVFNTAIALGRLGAPVSFLGGISTDTFGQQLCSDLTKSNVATDLLVRSPRLTTLALVHLQDGQATYAFYDDASAGRMLLPADLPAVPDSISALYFGGISLVAEPAADTYADLLARHAAQRVVMIDPNIRPDFITDEATYRARLGRMIAQSDIVKTSDEDLSWIVGGADMAAQADAILAKGPRFVIVTRGGDGATVYARSAHITVPAQAATVVDTVGAGDTFNAGFLDQLNADGLLSKQALASCTVHDLQPALNFAAKVAATTVSRAGANPPWRHELA